jgi:multidrug efflux pump subunit AcrB
VKPALEENPTLRAQYPNRYPTKGIAWRHRQNVGRQNGSRGAPLTVLKVGDASTIDVVQGIRDLLPRVVQTLPPELKIQPLADESIFVRAAISDVIRKAALAAAFTSVMILLFLGSRRSTLIIAISIPLSILTSVIPSDTLASGLV